VVFFLVVLVFFFFWGLVGFVCGFFVVVLLGAGAAVTSALLKRCFLCPHQSPSKIIFAFEPGPEDATILYFHHVFFFSLFKFFSLGSGVQDKACLSFSPERVVMWL